MPALWGPLLAALTIAQAPPPLAQRGEVVDDQGKPVAGARVVLYAPPIQSGEEVSAEVEGRTDTSGRFRVPWPKFRRMYVDDVTYQVYSPGLAVTAQAIFVSNYPGHIIVPFPHRMVLQKPLPRTVRVIGPDGRPIAAALFEPVRERMRHADDRELAAWRDEFLAWSLFDPRAATARLETVSVGNGPRDRQDDARIETAGSLGLSHDERWKRLFRGALRTLFRTTGRFF